MTMGRETCGDGTVTTHRPSAPLTFRELILAVAVGALTIALTAETLLAANEPLSGDTTLSASLVMSIVVWIIGALLTYGVVSSRIAVIEAKQTESDRRLERIELKLDRALEREAEHR